MKIIVFLDVETTGIVNSKKRWDDPCQPHIVSIGACAWTADGKQEVYSQYSIIRPDTFTIDDSSEATQVNGITQELALSAGVRYQAALIPLEHICHASWRVIVYNSKFEASLFEIERHRINRDHHPFTPDKTRCLMLKMASIMKIPSEYAHGEYKWPKFNAAYKYIFGEEPAEQHHALSDARNSSYLTFALQDQGLWHLEDQ